MRIGFIGMGNMAKAIAVGMIEKCNVDALDVYAYAPNQDKLLKNANEIGFNPMTSLEAMVDATELLIVACKPYQIEGVLEQLGNRIEGKAILSVAAGWFHDTFKEKINCDVRIQCIMPNTPAMVSEGVFLFEDIASLNADEDKFVKDIFSTLGMIETLPTNLMGIGGAISGCGPAFMDLIMEAYADAAVKYGISRPTAYRLIAKTMLGSAKLQLETGKHPGVLKDEVCSPAGTTICGVDALEHGGLRAACIDSIDAIMLKKSK